MTDFEPQPTIGPPAYPTTTDAPHNLRGDVIDSLWVLVAAGIPTGAIICGLGSRLLMLLLRLTSPESVIGITSDDGFAIGQVTPDGTYSLLMLGATFGIIGAAAYQWVSPWLIGPTWFRRLTVGLAAGAVVGSMLLHADGVDFTRLKPTWLAIASFIALPAAFGAAIGVTVDQVKRNAAIGRQNRARWLWALAFPITLIPLAIATVVLLAWKSIQPQTQGAPTGTAAFVVRSMWLAIATLGLVQLIDDIRSIA